MKNLSPAKLIALSSLAVSVTGIAAMLFLENLGYPLGLRLLLAGLILFFVSDVIFSVLVRKFLFEKIKLIYKIIRRVKGEKILDDKIDLNKNVLQETENEVLNWQRKQSKEIKQLKKMEKFRRQYVGNVSHELKTPIFNIQGYLETLLAGVEDEHLRRNFLQKAMQNVERLNVIVRDLDIISRSETGDLKLEKQPFNIKRLIEEVYAHLEMQAQNARVELTFKPGKCEGYTVYADRERIRQVLQNLVVNAIHYNVENGKVTASCYDMGEMILVEISDTGIGIKQKHLPHLFERFYRVDKMRSREKGGSGLGLSIVKHLLEAHGQSVHVRSKYGKGSTFGFMLPKALAK